MKIIYAFLFAAAATLPVAALAEVTDITVGQYLQAKNKEKINAYIAGVGIGYHWANAYLHAANRQPILCIPSKIIFNQEAILSSLNKELRSGNYSSDEVVDAIVPVALRKSFPCQ